MEIGAAISFPVYSMAPTDLAVAREERGFDSLWVAEHSHIPVTRRFSHPLGDAALTKEYFEVMDPFVTLSAAAAIPTVSYRPCDCICGCFRAISRPTDNSMQSRPGGGRCDRTFGTFPQR